MSGDDQEPEWPFEALAEGWVALAERVATLPPDGWDHLVCQFSESGAVHLYAERCLASPLPRQEHPGEKVAAHFSLSFAAEVRPEVPLVDAAWAAARIRAEREEQAAADDGTEAEVGREDVEGLYADLVAASLGEPEVAASFASLGGPVHFGVHWCGEHEGGYCVHHRHAWGRRLPELAPATTALGALAPLYWHAHSYVGSQHSGLGMSDGVLIEALLQGPDVTDATLALLTPAAAAACGSLRTLTLANAGVSEDAVARLRALLPHVEVDVRATPVPYRETPYARLRGGERGGGTVLRRLRTLF